MILPACEACRTAIHRGGRQPPLVELGRGPGPTSLRRCQRCGALWEETLREAHVISDADARRDFPDVEIPPRPE